jgi:hypothetical protein
MLPQHMGVMCWDTLVSRLLCSTLRWKSKADSSSKGQRSFICREEKGKATWEDMQQDPETGSLLSQVGRWVL